MALFEYVQQVQRFLREQKQDFENPDDLISYVNRARREIALRSQCIRVLTPSAGQIIGYSVTAGGSGYTSSATVTVSAPDFPSGALPDPNGQQATALPVVAGDVIAAVDGVYGGAGYFQPTVTVVDTVGTGATVEAIVGGVNTVNLGQERYSFEDIDLSAFPGVGSVFAVRGASIIYSNYRYSLPMYSFTVYQAMIRQYPYQYQYVPTFFSQFAQGNKGTLYFYPLPSQTYQLELDCQVLPSDLIDDQSYEAIPQPWTDAVPYFAAHLAMMELQNYNAANFYLQLYEKFALSYSQFTRIGRAVNPYGRY